MLYPEKRYTGIREARTHLAQLARAATDEGVQIITVRHKPKVAIVDYARFMRMLEILEGGDDGRSGQELLK